MSSADGSGGLHPGLPGGLDPSKKKRVMFDTMPLKDVANTSAGGGLESRISVGSSAGSSFINSSSNQSPTKR